MNQAMISPDLINKRVVADNKEGTIVAVKYSDRMAYWGDVHSPYLQFTILFNDGHFGHFRANEVTIK